MTEHRPIWQDGGIHTPTPPWLPEWETKMDPLLFDHRARVRRAFRTPYDVRFVRDMTVLLGIIGFCAVVWWAVWGVMA